MNRKAQHQHEVFKRSTAVERVLYAERNGILPSEISDHMLAMQAKMDEEIDNGRRA